jgi:hypothetical protein
MSHDFAAMRSNRDRDWRHYGQTSKRRSTKVPLESLIIKTLAMIIIRVSMDGYAKGYVRETGRHAACQQQTQGSHTHDRDAE